MPAGYIIAESIRPGSKLKGFAFTLTSIERYPVDNATDDQPTVRSWGGAATEPGRDGREELTARAKDGAK